MKIAFVALFAAVVWTSASCASESAGYTNFSDAVSCRDKTAALDQRLAACKRILASPFLTGQAAFATYQNMGVVFKESGDYPDALKAFNFAIEGAPNMWQAYSNRSSTYAEMGQYDSALQDADKVIELKPDVPNGYGLWCWIAGDKNADLDKALLDCNQAVDLQVKSAELLNTRGFIYFRMSNFPAAIADYTSALAIKPKFAASLYMRGITRLKMADSVNGNDDIAAAKALQPDIGEQYAKLGVTP